MASSITVDGKQLKSAEEVRSFLLDELAQGHEMIPIGKQGVEGMKWRGSVRNESSNNLAAVGKPYCLRC
jgi:hypothetical protein